MSQPTVLITGASGFFGQALCREFLDAGWNVRAGIRCRSAVASLPEGCEPVHCNLPSQIETSAFRRLTACVHAAYPMGETNRRAARRAALGGTLALLHECKRSDVRPIFISSCSAHDRAESFYGRSKLHLEAEFLAQDGLVLRPGFLLGGGGLFLRLVQSVRRLPVIPMFGGGGQPVQTIPVELAASGVRRAIEGELMGRLILAEPEAITMRRFFSLIAEGLGRRASFLPVPIAPVLPLLRAAECARVPLPVTRENLLGWRGAHFQPSSRSLQQLDLYVPSAEETVPRAAALCEGLE